MSLHKFHKIFTEIFKISLKIFNQKNLEYSTKNFKFLFNFSPWEILTKIYISTDIQEDNRGATPTDESSRSSIWLRRVQGRDEVSRTGSGGKLAARDSKHSIHSSTIIKGRANKVASLAAHLSQHHFKVLIRTLFHQEMVANIKQRHIERIYTTDNFLLR